MSYGQFSEFIAMAFLTSASSAINTQPIMAQFLKAVITVFFLGLRWVFTPYAGS